MTYFDLTQCTYSDVFDDLQDGIKLLKEAEKERDFYRRKTDSDEQTLIYFVQELIEFIEDYDRKHPEPEAKPVEEESYFDGRPDLCHPTDLPEGIHLNRYGNLITVPKGWISTDKDRRNPIINAAYKKHMAYAKVEWVKGQGKKSKYYPDHYIILNYWHHPSINPNPPKKKKRKKKGKRLPK